jgi:hypothetical protein
VDTAVPGNVDEPDELVSLTRADPAETVRVDLRIPVVGQDVMSERLGVERVHFVVTEAAAPFVRDLHAQDFRA